MGLGFWAFWGLVFAQVRKGAVPFLRVVLSQARRAAALFFKSRWWWTGLLAVLIVGIGALAGFLSTLVVIVGYFLLCWLAMTWHKGQLEGWGAGAGAPVLPVKPDKYLAIYAADVVVLFFLFGVLSQAFFVPLSLLSAAFSFDRLFFLARGMWGLSFGIGLSGFALVVGCAAFSAVSFVLFRVALTLPGAAQGRWIGLGASWAMSQPIAKQVFFAVFGSVLLAGLITLAQVVFFFVSTDVSYYGEPASGLKEVLWAVANLSLGAVVLLGSFLLIFVLLSALSELYRFAGDAARTDREAAKA